jgi:hypothetical protein
MRSALENGKGTKDHTIIHVRARRVVIYWMQRRSKNLAACTYTIERKIASARTQSNDKILCSPCSRKTSICRRRII